MAVGAGVSTVEEFMPALQQGLLIFDDQVFDSIDLMRHKAVTVLQAYGIEPKLGRTVIAFHMHVWRFISIARVKEKSVRAALENCGHPSRQCNR